MPRHIEQSGGPFVLREVLQHSPPEISRLLEELVSGIAKVLTSSGKSENEIATALSSLYQPNPNRSQSYNRGKDVVLCRQLKRLINNLEASPEKKEELEQIRSRLERYFDASVQSWKKLGVASADAAIDLLQKRIKDLEQISRDVGAKDTITVESGYVYTCMTKVATTQQSSPWNMLIASLLDQPTKSAGLNAACAVSMLRHLNSLPRGQVERVNFRNVLEILGRPGSSMLEEGHIGFLILLAHNIVKAGRYIDFSTLLDLVARPQNDRLGEHHIGMLLQLASSVVTSGKDIDLQKFIGLMENRRNAALSEAHIGMLIGLLRGIKTHVAPDRVRTHVAGIKHFLRTRASTSVLQGRIDNAISIIDDEFPAE